MKVKQIETTVVEMPYKKLVRTTNKFVVARGSFHQVESRHDLSKYMTNCKAMKRR